jgi:hypothetical protein
VEKEPEETLNLEEDDAENQEPKEEAEDRGDNPNPYETPENLAAVAGEDEEEVEDGAAKAKGSRVVPHERFNEVNETLKAERAARLKLEEELARLRGMVTAGKPDQGAQPQPKAFDIDAKEEEYANALMEGDVKKAAQIRKEINAEITRQALENASSAAEARVSARVAKSEFENTVAAVIETYPFLDSTSKAANQEAIEMVVALRDGFIAKGDSPAEALAKAASKVGPLFSQETPSDDAAEDRASGTKVLELRRKSAITRNARTAAQQPPPLGGVGNRASNLALRDVEQMTDEEFQALPAAEKRRLRGD